MNNVFMYYVNKYPLALSYLMLKAYRSDFGSGSSNMSNLSCYIILVMSLPSTSLSLAIISGRALTQS